MADSQDTCPQGAGTKEVGMIWPSEGHRKKVGRRCRGDTSTHAGEGPQGETALRMLDLFCGTGSVARVNKAEWFEVETLDQNPKWQATYTTSILDWDYRRY